MRKDSGSSSRGPKSDKSSGYRKDDARKPYGKKERPFDKQDKPYRKSDDGAAKRGARPFDDKRERPARPDGEDRPKRKFEDREERGERKTGGFKRPFEDRGDHRQEGETRRPFDRKPSRDGEERPARKFDSDRKPAGRKRSEDGDGERKPFKKPFEDRRKDFDSRDKFADRKAGYKKRTEDDGEQTERPRRTEGDRPARKFDGEKKRFEGGDRFDKKPGFKKKFDGEGKGDRDFDKKPGKKFDKNDKFADRKAGKPKFNELDIFGKDRKNKKKEDDENFIQNENEGFSKTLKDKYKTEKPTRKPSTRKRSSDDDDDEDDDIDIKTNAARYNEVEVSGPMPLNKYIAHSGQCSRREAADLVKKGKVKVNGEMMLDPGYRVMPEDTVILGGKKLTPQRNFVYILLNKPKGFITTTDDPEGRKTVMELVASAEVERLFPVGRLDRNTTGLLLLTNDGDLTQKLSHPSYEIKKIYQATLDKALSKPDFDKILAGLELEDGPATVDSLAYLENKNEIGLEIHSGKNRIVRRIFESLGYEVEKLDRVMYAGLTKKNIGRGEWRFLTEREVVLLKHFKQ
ncbi:pseudouridine synthase [Chitinophagaceae bacterium MMS25-I14]